MCHCAVDIMVLVFLGCGKVMMYSLGPDSPARVFIYGRQRRWREWWMERAREGGGGAEKKTCGGGVFHHSCIFLSS